MKCIKYKGGYKYQLKESYTLKIPLTPTTPIQSDYLRLSKEGTLWIKEGYAWDGPSGPTIDTPSFMRGSLVHDALYQLMRLDLLDRDTYRKRADKILRDICKEDGMWSLRAAWVYLGVRWFGDPAADPAEEHPLSYVPEGCEQ